MLDPQQQKKKKKKKKKRKRKKEAIRALTKIQKVVKFT